MTIKAIIFDMDGVLTDSMGYHIKCWKTAFKEFNIQTTNEEIALLEGMPSKEIINTISKKYSIKLSPKTKKEIAETKRKKMDQIFKLKIYSNIKKILTILKNKQIKLALVTGSNKDFTKNIIKKEFKNLFEVIVTGDDVKIGKPNPEPYLIASKKLKIQKQNILVIENAPLGITSATKAKLKTYALSTTLNKKYLKDAEKIFPSHKELLREIKTIIK